MGGTAASKYSEDTIDLLAAQLECPVCLNRCTLPIFMCSNGHNVCSTCQPSLNTCPVCRVAGRPRNRNLFAEEFLQHEVVPCKNVEQGCKKVYKLKEMPEHLKLCKFGLKCMFEDCKWRGSVAALLEHAQSIHSEYVIDVGKDGVKFLNNGFEGVCVKCGEKCDRPIIRTAMLKFDDHYFWFMSEQTVDSKTFKVQIRLIGNSKDEPIYGYQLTFQRSDCLDVERSWSNKVRSLVAPAFSDVVFSDAGDMELFVHYNSMPFVLKLEAGKVELKATSPSELREFNPQLREKPLPNWEDLDYVELGRGDNDRILTKKEFSKYFRCSDYERNRARFQGVFLIKGYKDYLLHSADKDVDAKADDT